MEEKIKVIILGLDQQKLEKVCDRINGSKPVDVTLHTELQSFLQICIEKRPEIIGISLSYPHQSITKFPRVFRMALNIPVIIFAEDDKPTSRKLLSETNSEYKINGQINPTNLWIKIANFKKEQEEASSEKGGKDKKSGQGKDKDTVVLKGSGKDNKSTSSNEDRKKLLRSIISQFDDDQDEKGNSKVNMVKSGKATKFKPTHANHINTVDMKGLNEEEDETNSKGSAQGNKQGEANTNKAGSTDHINPGDLDSKGTGSQNSQATTDTSNPLRKGSFNPETQSNNNFDSEAYNPSNKQQLKTSSDNELNLASHSNSSSMGSQGSNQEQKNQIATKSLDNGNQSKLANNMSLKKSSQQNKEEHSKQNLNMSKKSNDGQSPTTSKTANLGQNSSLGKNNLADRSKPQGEVGSGKDGPQAKNSNEQQRSDLEKDKSQNPKKPFGSIKQIDKEKSSKAEDKAEARQKKKEDEENQRNIFKESCEYALETTFMAQKLERTRSFDTESVTVYVVEMASIKGYLMMTNSFNHSVDPLTSDDFRINIASAMKEKGQTVEISEPVVIEVKLENYREVVSAFSDFFVDYEEETGKQHVLSFVQRESVRPKFEDSDKDGMFLVDIKSIPPKTVVNFDAFLYLPKNKKFVRYLKEGRSLSLEQAKRHVEMFKNTKFYLPADNKQRFIQFFIQNTIDWEVAIQKTLKAG